MLLKQVHIVTSHYHSTIRENKQSNCNFIDVKTLIKIPTSTMEPDLNKYIEELTKKTEKHDLKFDIGYPLNLKGHDVHGKAKGMLTQTIPFLIHLGNPFILNPFWTAQCMEEEKTLMVELLAPWGGIHENTWGYMYI